VDRSTQRTLESPDVHDLVLSREVQELTDPQASRESPMLVVIRLLWRQRLRLAKATLVTLVIAAAVAVVIPNSYEGTVQLMPPDNSSISGGMAMLGALMGGGGLGSSGGAGAGGSITSGLGELLGGQKPGALFVGILGCRTMADRLIDRFDLRKVYWRKTYIATRNELASRTSISEDRKTGLISITVRDHDRVRAAAIAQAYVEELNRLLAQINTSSASREAAFLEQRLDVVHKELETVEKDLSQFSSKNTMLNPQDQGKAMVEAAAVLQGQLIAAQSELSGLEQIYTSENVRVRSLRAHVEELQNQLNKLGGKNYTGSTTLDPDALYPSLRQLPVLGLQYAELYRRAKIDETVFALLTEQHEMAKVQEAKETPSVKVLDAARPAERKVWPPRILLTFFGGVLGFFFTVCWIVGAELWSEIDPNDPHKKFLQDAWAEGALFFNEKLRPLSPSFGRVRSWNGNSGRPERDQR
jgi:capsule polysaccharide export protein KpsE/RkpR